MLRHHRILILLPALALLACESSSSTAPTAKNAPPLPPPAASIAQITGVIEALAPNDSTNLFLRLAAGDRLRLEGAEVPRLARVVGAEVMVRGTLDVVSGIYVASFVVVSVNGELAADGVLMTTGDGYAIRLIADGSIRALIDPPVELTFHVGERVWVTGALGESLIAFGVIGGDS